MPKDLCKAMKWWDKGLISLPAQYNHFQMQLAEQEIGWEFANKLENNNDKIEKLKENI